MYSLPKFNLPKIKRRKKSSFLAFKFQHNNLVAVGLIVLVSFIFGSFGGIVTGSYFYSEVKDYLEKLNIKIPEIRVIEEKENEYVPQTSREDLIIKTVKDVSPSVVSIIVTKDMPVFEGYYVNPFGFQFPQYRQKGTEKREIGGGTGFIISSDGMILTNSHVVSDKEAEYTVLNNKGEEFSAEVLARDPIIDLAIIKIESESTFNPVKFGNSDKLQPGQTVIAIGNALGEFRNTVSIGVISGLRRTITASGSGITEILEDIIQTDAAINKGNSGGPLLNLKGEVIGINVAMSQVAENIGFAIPINNAKRDIEQVKTLGKIIYPFLGIRYLLINPIIQEKNNLSVDFGAWIIKGLESGQLAVTPGSAAEKAGLKEGDIILEFDEEKISQNNSLAKIIRKRNPGDKVVLKVLSGVEEKIISVILDGKEPEI